MPKKTVVIEWDWPDEEFWLPADSIALALHAYCKNTHFVVTDAAQPARALDGGCRCDLQDTPDAPADWHGKNCPLYRPRQ